MPGPFQGSRSHKNQWFSTESSRVLGALPVRFNTTLRVLKSWGPCGAALLVGILGSAATPSFAAAPGDAKAASPAFRQAAEETGLEFVHFNGMIGRLYFPEAMGGGVALIDYDNDGDLDVYLGQGAMLGEDSREDLIFPPKTAFPQHDRLFRNDLKILPDGSRQIRFVDVTTEAKLSGTGYNMGVATGDFDNDGWVDLYVTNLGSNQLLRNNRDGTFSDTTERAGADDKSWSVAASFLDYDRDGTLDLFVGNYNEFRYKLHKECTNATGTRAYCGPLSYPLLPNRLLRNRGDGTFENVSGSALVGNPEGSTLGTVIGDFNGDDWIDVYAANDLVPNHLWLNQRDGTFLEDAELAGSAVDAKGQPQASMGVVAGDLNGDGHEDLFMSHLRMEMNTIYINDGTGLFEDRSSTSGLGRASFPYTGFGTALFDYDNDGVVDLYVGNGAVKRIESQLRAGDLHPLHEENLLFRGLGKGRYERVSKELVADRVHSQVSRGVASGDIDNDGDTDLVVVNNAGTVRLLLNQVGSANAWLGLRLRLGDSKGDAVGARVELQTEHGSQFRRVRTDGSYCSANDPRLLFGLGAAPPKILGLKITWPDGTPEALPPDRLELGEYMSLHQPQSEPLKKVQGEANSR